MDESIKRQSADVETLLAAIRAKCTDCSGHSRKLADGCRMMDCPLHPYRMGCIRETKKRNTPLCGQIDVFSAIRAVGNA